MPTGIPAPQFQITMFWVKWIENGTVKQAWDMLASVGSPGHNAPIQIPAWTSAVGSYNLQVEVTVKNLTGQTLDLKLRVQVCPRNTSGLPPLPIPPCGQLLDSPADIHIGSGFTWILPIWQLQMWSESIDLHLEVVDAVDQTVYNCIVPYYDNAGYRADDFYVPIDVKSGPDTFNITVHVQDQQSVAVQGASVNLS